MSNQKIETNNYTKKYFTLDEHDVSIPGWSNNQKWNGWSCPHFEEEAVLNALENGGFIENDHYFKIIKIDDAVISIQSQSGPIPDSFDFKSIIEALKNDEHIYEYKISDTCCIDAEIFEKHTINVEGKDVDVYSIGSQSWCWTESDEPIVSNSLSI